MIVHCLAVEMQVKLGLRTVRKLEENRAQCIVLGCYCFEGLTLQAAQPALVGVANQWRKHLNQPGAHWLVTVDVECAWICLINDGRWRHVKRYARFQLTPDSLDGAIQREKIFADADFSAERILLYAPGFEWTQSSAAAGMTVESPPLFARGEYRDAEDDMQLALAV